MTAPSVSDPIRCPARASRSQVTAAPILAVADRQDQFQRSASESLEGFRTFGHQRSMRWCQRRCDRGDRAREPDVRLSSRPSYGRDATDLNGFTHRKWDESASPVTPRARHGLRCGSIALAGDIRDLGGTQPFPGSCRPLRPEMVVTRLKFSGPHPPTRVEQLLATQPGATQPLMALLSVPEGLPAARVRSFLRCRVSRTPVPWAAHQEPGSVAKRWSVRGDCEERGSDRSHCNANRPRVVSRPP